MRVSQLQNLTWAGNVVVLVGLAWVGVVFWEASKKKPAPEWAWPKVKVGAEGAKWPGDLAAFTHVWKTEIGGKVPPPPAAPTADKPKEDRWTEFKNKFKYLSGWECIGQSWRSTVNVNFEGKDCVIRPGDEIGGFQLLQFTLVPVVSAKPDADKRPVNVARVVFRNPENGLAMPIDQAAVPQTLSDTKNPLFVKEYGANVRPDTINETDPLPQKAYLDPGTNEWIVPADEQVWIERFAEKAVLGKLAAKPETDAQGATRGLRILAFPEIGTPLAPSHGIGQGDVVRSINGVAIASKNDVLDYLRGAGKALDRYEVVVETDHAERTIVYRVPRPVHRPSRD